MRRSTPIREPLVENVRRLAKRHRTLATALAVLLVTATAALAVGLVLVGAARRETQKALDNEIVAREHWQAAEQSASEQRQLALKTVRRVVNVIHARLKDRPGHKELRKALLAQALDGLKEVARAADTAAQVDHQTIAVYFEVGDIFLEIEEGGTAQAKKEFEKANELARQQVDGAPESGQAQFDLAISYQKLGDVQLRLRDSKRALAAYQQCLVVAEPLARANPQNAQAQRILSISWSAFSCGALPQHPKRPGPAHSVHQLREAGKCADSAGKQQGCAVGLPAVSDDPRAPGQRRPPRHGGQAQPGHLLRESG
jgi:tetratricopeptide (TPR) repeat protein